MILRHVLDLQGFLIGFIDVYLRWTTEIILSSESLSHTESNNMYHLVSCLCVHISVSYESEKEYDFWRKLQQLGAKDLTPYLIAGAFEDKVALLNEVKGELEVQIGALAQGLEVGAELAEGGVVHLAIERDVVLNLRAAVDAVQDVALQVLVYGVILLQAVQRDAMERQRVGDLLNSRNHFGQKLIFSDIAAETSSFIWQQPTYLLA